MNSGNTLNSGQQELEGNEWTSEFGDYTTDASSVVGDNAGQWQRMAQEVEKLGAEDEIEEGAKVEEADAQPTLVEVESPKPKTGHEALDDWGRKVALTFPEYWEELQEQYAEKGKAIGEMPNTNQLWMDLEQGWQDSVDTRSSEIQNRLRMAMTSTLSRYASEIALRASSPQAPGANDSDEVIMRDVVRSMNASFECFYGLNADRQDDLLKARPSEDERILWALAAEPRKPGTLDLSRLSEQHLRYDGEKPDDYMERIKNYASQGPKRDRQLKADALLQKWRKPPEMRVRPIKDMFDEIEKAADEIAEPSQEEAEVNETENDQLEALKDSYRIINERMRSGKLSLDDYNATLRTLEQRLWMQEDGEVKQRWAETVDALKEAMLAIRVRQKIGKAPDTGVDKYSENNFAGGFCLEKLRLNRVIGDLETQEDWTKALEALQEKQKQDEETVFDGELAKSKAYDELRLIRPAIRELQQRLGMFGSVSQEKAKPVERLETA